MIHKYNTYRLSFRNPNDHEKYVNNPPMWEAGEALLRRVMRRIGLNFYEAEGEAAFYGPKIDVQFQTAQGKDETLSPSRSTFISRPSARSSTSRRTVAGPSQSWCTVVSSRLWSAWLPSS